MSAFAVSPEYSALLVRFPPQVIQTEEQNEAYIEALYELDRTGASDSPEVHEYAALLTLLIENFEEQHYSMPKGTQRDALEFLLDQHSLDAKALASVEGLDGTIAQVVDGKRELTAPEIRALSAHFRISPELFF